MWATRGALGLCLLAVALPAAAVSKAELEKRIEQLERRLDSRGLVDLMEQVTALQREVAQLRGDVEVQAHAMESLQKRQRELYLDIDRRLHRLETGGEQGAAAASAGTPAPPSAAAGPAPVSPPPAAGRAAAPSVAPATATAGGDGRKEYDQALEVLKEGRYEEAARKFKDFLERYPRSSYADNAQYWLGEVYYVTRKFGQALDEFGKVLAQYPDSSKVADARLKMGYIYYEQKDWNRARDMLGTVVKAHAGTTAARLAQERLDRMKREGHLK